MAFTVTFSPVDSSSVLLDKIYSFGGRDYEATSMMEEVEITQEVLGVYFIPDAGPDYEGLVLYLEDGSYERVGLDQAYTPVLSDFQMLDARLDGFSAKFA